jgi:hypothetical protein
MPLLPLGEPSTAVECNKSNRVKSARPLHSDLLESADEQVFEDANAQATMTIILRNRIKSARPLHSDMLESADEPCSRSYRQCPNPLTILATHEYM